MCLILMVSEPYFKSSIPEFMLHLLVIYDLSRFNKIQTEWDFEGFKFLAQSGFNTPNFFHYAEIFLDVVSRELSS